MKKILPFIVLSGLMLFLFPSCEDECKQEHTYYNAIPIVKPIAEIRKETALTAPRALKHPGKIYFYQDYILINEVNEGLHIVDNRDAYNPLKVGFLDIPGNTEMAIRGNTLFANNYMDLLAINISNWQSLSLASRSENLFPMFNFDANGDVIVDYEYEEITELIDCNGGGRGGWFESDVLASNTSGGGGSGGAVPGTSTGTGGSLARFTLVDNFLYIINDWQLEVFQVDNPSSIVPMNTVNMGWGIETIFPYGENLFIGSQTGMFIFDNSNPASPELMSVFEHARACDPVVVQDDIAYVTLRDGNECQTFTNQLDVVDVSNLTEPRLIRSYNMDNPHGLSAKGDHLFICEGEHGLKSLDISDLSSITTLQSLKDLTSYDVIARPGNQAHLFVIGDGGFYQYDYSNASDLQLMSSILVEE